MAAAAVGTADISAFTYASTRRRGDAVQACPYTTTVPIDASFSRRLYHPLSQLQVPLGRAMAATSQARFDINKVPVDELTVAQLLNPSRRVKAAVRPPSRKDVAETDVRTGTVAACSVVTFHPLASFCGCEASIASTAANHTLWLVH